MNAMLERLNPPQWAWIWLALIWPVGALGCVRADEVAELRATVRKLQQENQEIRNRLLAIEKRLAGEAEPKATPPNPIGDQAGGNAWRKLRVGMEADKVVALLGEPEKVKTVPLLTFWYFKTVRDGGTAPTVTFNTDGMTVYGWEEP